MGKWIGVSKNDNEIYSYLVAYVNHQVTLQELPPMLRKPSFLSNWYWSNFQKFVDVIPNYKNKKRKYDQSLINLFQEAHHFSVRGIVHEECFENRLRHFAGLIVEFFQELLRSTDKKIREKNVNQKSKREPEPYQILDSYLMDDKDPDWVSDSVVREAYSKLSPDEKKGFSLEPVIWPVLNRDDLDRNVELSIGWLDKRDPPPWTTLTKEIRRAIKPQFQSGAREFDEKNESGLSMNDAIETNVKRLVRKLKLKK